MPASETPARARKSAAERREEIVAIGIRHFAAGGYHGTSTEAIAAEAGISQPYLFRLFKTKRELFIACVDAVDGRIMGCFQDAARGNPQEEALAHMGKAYVELLEDRTQLRFQMQAYAAGSDEVIRDRVRSNYGALVAEVTRLSGAEPALVWQFFAQGMLLNVIASLDLSAIADSDPWAAAWCDPMELLRESG